MSAEKTSSLLAEMRMLLRPLTDPSAAPQDAGVHLDDVLAGHVREGGGRRRGIVLRHGRCADERERAKAEMLRREIDSLRKSQNDAAVGAGFDACAEEAACALSNGKGFARCDR